MVARSSALLLLLSSSSAVSDRPTSLPHARLVPRPTNRMKHAFQALNSEIHGQPHDRPLPARIVAVDFGTKRVGLALGQSGIAFQTLPVERLPEFDASPGSYSKISARILDVAQKERATGIVVGIPVGGSGNVKNWRLDTIQGRRCRELARFLNRRCEDLGYDIQVFMVDEAGSSKIAREELGLGNDKRLNVGKVDSAAAQVIAKTYFESKENVTPIQASQYGSEALSSKDARKQMRRSRGYRSKLRTAAMANETDSSNPTD
mmetsp:Transcript_6835/g.9438  ORF Transcript_6835/g.9438 Transcript_6835/m.9438 type:complete len:262 (+) Transcript_6835:22-807(+)